MAEAFNQWALAARNALLIVVLDEFPWAVEADPSLEGELQVAWDTTLSKLPILLILIGSDVAMMSRLMEHDRPLFRRVTPMVVPALNPTEVAEALPGRSASRYRPTNPCMRFWFRYIAHHLEDISRSRGDIAVAASTPAGPAGVDARSNPTSTKP